jgi:hypothetical protein
MLAQVVNEPVGSPSDDVARAVKYIAILGLFLLAVAIVAGAVAARRLGTGAYQASAVAAAMIWLVGAISLLMIGAARTRTARVNCAMMGLFVRMSLPLAAVLYFSRSGHTLAQHGIVALLVVHYLAGLTLETYFAIRVVAAAEGDARLGGNVAAHPSIDRG